MHVSKLRDDFMSFGVLKLETRPHVSMNNCHDSDDLFSFYNSLIVRVFNHNSFWMPCHQVDLTTVSEHSWQVMPRSQQKSKVSTIRLQQTYLWASSLYKILTRSHFFKKRGAWETYEWSWAWSLKVELSPSWWYLKDGLSAPSVANLWPTIQNLYGTISLYFNP